MIYDVVIIGSGPAGLAAAIYAQRAKLNAVVLEKAGISGGQVLTTYEVDNYPGLPGISGYDLSGKMRSHADALGAKFVEAVVTSVEDQGSIKLVYTIEETYQTRTVLIATGATHAGLKVPGEKEFAGMGVSYCATCDGAFFKNRTVAVVGGGDVAVEDAIFLAKICRKVYLIHRRDELRAAKSLQEAAFQLPNIEPIWNSTVAEISGQDQVNQIIIKNTIDQGKKSLAVDGVFIAVGIYPNTDLFGGVAKMDEKGYFLAGEDGATSRAGIYVAGDARKKPLRQIVTAVADGANAINSIQSYLSKVE